MKREVSEFINMFNGRLQDCGDYTLLVEIQHKAHGIQEARVKNLTLDHVRECVVLKAEY